MVSTKIRESTTCYRFATGFAAFARLFLLVVFKVLFIFQIFAISIFSISLVQLKKMCHLWIQMATIRFWEIMGHRCLEGNECACV